MTTENSIVQGRRIVSNRKFGRRNPKRNKPRAAIRPQARPQLEALEDRTVLTAVVTGVGVSDPIQILVTTSLNPSTVNSSTIKLLDSSGHAVATQAAYNATTN